MENYLIAAGFVLWMAALVVPLILGMDGIMPMPASLAVVAVVLVGGLGFAMNEIAKEGERGPCVRSEVQMHYNPATKTMMPARVCIQRGEWVEE